MKKTIAAMLVVCLLAVPAFAGGKSESKTPETKANLEGYPILDGTIYNHHWQTTAFPFVYILMVLYYLIAMESVHDLVYIFALYIVANYGLGITVFFD